MANAAGIVFLFRVLYIEGYKACANLGCSQDDIEHMFYIVTLAASIFQDSFELEDILDNFTTATSINDFWTKGADGILLE